MADSSSTSTSQGKSGSVGSGESRSHVNGSHVKGKSDGGWSKSGKSSPGLDAARTLTELAGKKPPHALEAEAALLGSIIIDSSVLGEVCQILTGPEDFYSVANSAVYRVLLELYDSNPQFDSVQILSQLRQQSLLETVGGLDYVLQLPASVPSAAGAVSYARIVRDKAVLRRLIETAGEILYEAHHSGEPVDDQLDAAEQKIFSLAQRTSNEASDLQTLLHELYERLEAMEGVQLTGIDSGFMDLNEYTSGLQPGELIIVAGRPSMGKTAFALNIAEHVAATNKQPVAVFSLEMGKHQLAQRLLCSRSGVDSQKLRRNMLSNADYGQLQMSMDDLHDAPLFIDDTPGLTLLGLRAKARRLAERHHIKLIVIDYLQLLTSPQAARQGRQQEVSELSRGVKALARELEVPVICLSQLNRASEGREDHRPRMSDLRESGSIEQDADVIMMLHREDYYRRNDEGYVPTNVAEVLLVKQRNGPTGKIELQFDADSTRFNNLTRRDMGAMDDATYGQTFEDPVYGPGQIDPPPV